MEKRFDYRMANLIYLKALEIDAKPKSIIAQRYEGFQQRIKYYGIHVGGNDGGIETTDVEILDRFCYDYDINDGNSFGGDPRVSANCLINHDESRYDRQPPSRIQSFNEMNKEKNRTRRDNAAPKAMFTIYEEEVSEKVFHESVKAHSLSHRLVSLESRFCLLDHTLNMLTHNNYNKARK